MSTTIPRSCEHCHREIPFGRFELLRKSMGNVKNAEWSFKHNCYIQRLERYLCAQCGFNIVNHRVMRVEQMPERVEKLTGESYIAFRDLFIPNRPYVQCTLITSIMETVDLAQKADQLRYHEQVEALEAQRRARRLKALEWKLRHIGSTVREQLKGVMPLSEDEIQDTLEKAAAGGATSGIARPPVREIVLGGVSPRKKSRDTATEQRVSSTSPMVGAVSVPAPVPAPSSRPSPRRAANSIIRR